MNHKRFNRIMLVLFISFLVIYCSANVGLIDYQARNKRNLTEKEIAKFEEDVEKGIPIDLSSYSKDNNRYDNTLSKITLDLSKTIGNTAKSILDLMFKHIEESMKK